jgi:hypothetical protein
MYKYDIFTAFLEPSKPSSIVSITVKKYCYYRMRISVTYTMTKNSPKTFQLKWSFVKLIHRVDFMN